MKRPTATSFAAFATPETFLHALRSLRSAGYDDLDAFSPFPVAGAAEALALPRSPLNWIVLPFALTGGAAAYLIQWLCNAVDYPLNVGGRPAHSAPAFVPITFEMTVLAAGVVAFIATFALSGLPRFAHTTFTLPGFERVSNDHFWIAVGVGRRDPQRVERTLRELGATGVVHRNEEEP